MNRPAPRRGISLIEVIAATAIIAVMIVPIAGVMRASSQSIAAAEGDASDEASMRTALRWLSTTVRDSDVLRVRSRRLVLRLSDGNTASIQVRRRNLVMRIGTDETILCQGVRDVQFQAINRVTPPVSRTGIRVTARMRDADGNWTTVENTISELPQV